MKSWNINGTNINEYVRQNYIEEKKEEEINNNSNFISTYLKVIEMIRKLNEKYKYRKYGIK